MLKLPFLAHVLLSLTLAGAGFEDVVVPLHFA